MTYLPYCLGTEGQSQLTAPKETVETDLPHCPERSGERPLTVRKTRTQTIRCPGRPGVGRFTTSRRELSVYASVRPVPVWCTEAQQRLPPPSAPRVGSDDRRGWVGPPTGGRRSDPSEGLTNGGLISQLRAVLHVTRDTIPISVRKRMLLIGH